MSAVTIHRTPGEGRYARVEREQRWVMSALPAGLSDPASIVDVYLTGTRLRLRSVAAGGLVTYKLGQKVRPEPGSPAVVQLTNIYLSPQEYEVLRGLSGRELRKTRWRSELAGGRVVVDEFGGRLAGLILAELELRPGESPADLGPTAVDVTEDDRFSGGHLAGLAAPAAAEVLAVAAELLRSDGTTWCPTEPRHG